MAFDHLMEEVRAVEFLAARLGEGTLVLVLGAGASVGADLPQWRTLVDRLRAKAALAPVPVSAGADSLQLAADEVRRDFCNGNRREFAQLVKGCLYDGIALSSSLLKDDLLIALGALMIGSR